MPQKIKVLYDTNGDDRILTELKRACSIKKEEPEKASRDKISKVRSRSCSNVNNTRRVDVYTERTTPSATQTIFDIIKLLLIAVIGLVAIIGSFYCAVELRLPNIFLWFLIVTIPLMINLFIASLSKTKAFRFLKNFAAIAVWLIQNAINLQGVYRDLYYHGDLGAAFWFGIVGLALNIIAAVVAKLIIKKIGNNYFRNT